MDNNLSWKLRKIWNEDSFASQNYFTRNSQIPIFRNSYKGYSSSDIISLEEYGGYGNIIVIGSPASGKSTTAKRIVFYKSTRYGRPTIIFDYTGHEYILCKYPNSQPVNLLTRYENEIIEKPEGIKNLVPLSPSYVGEEADRKDKIMSLSPNDFEMENWSSVELQGVSFILDEIKELYPEVSDNPKELYEFVKKLPPSYQQAMEQNRRDGLFMFPSSFSSFMIKFRKLMKKGFFDSRYKIRIKELIRMLKTNTLCFNFHYEENFSRAYVGYILSNMFKIASKKKLKGLVIMTDEAEKIYPNYDKDKEFASTEYGSMVVKKGRRYGICNIVCTQELSSLHKEITDFYTHMIIGGELSRNDLRRLAELTSSKVVDTVKNLKFDPDKNIREMIVIKRNKTFDTGYPLNSPCELFREVRKIS